MAKKEIKIACKGADLLPIDKLIDFQGELKKITPENMQKLKNNIIKNNFSAPILIWKKSDKSKAYILDGHSRVKALLELQKEGYKIPAKLPVDYIKAINKKEAKEKLLGIASQYGIITEAGLMDFINEADLDIDSLIATIEIPDIDIVFPEEETIDDDEIPEKVKTITKMGDLWELGEHRVLCGDSTDAEQVKKLMAKREAKILFTSPPYSDMRSYGGNKDISINYIIKFIPAFRRYIKYQVINLGIQRKNGEIHEYWQQYIKEAKQCGYKLISWNIWNRAEQGGSVGAITGLFPIEHEWIFIFGYKANKNDFNKIIKNKHAGEFRSGGDRQADGSLINKHRYINKYRRMGTVQTISFERNLLNKRSHVAVFPIKLPTEYIKAMTDVNDSIIDSFIGSGSTLIACEKINRICYGMEIEPHYCDVIVQRYKDWCTKNNRTIKIKRNGKNYK